MTKYINTFSLHLFSICFVMLFMLSFEEPSVYLLGVGVPTFLLLVYTFYKRIKGMSEEEFVEKLGFKGNRFLDPTLD